MNVSELLAVVGDGISLDLGTETAETAAPGDYSQPGNSGRGGERRTGDGRHRREAGGRWLDAAGSSCFSLQKNGVGNQNSAGAKRKSQTEQRKVHK